MTAVAQLVNGLRQAILADDTATAKTLTSTLLAQGRKIAIIQVISDFEGRGFVKELEPIRSAILAEAEHTTTPPPPPLFGRKDGAWAVGL